MDRIVLPEIRQDRCDGCGLCVFFCPTQAVEMQKHRPVIVRPNACAYCGDCEELCPNGAIALPYEIALQDKHGGFAYDNE